MSRFVPHSTGVGQALLGLTACAALALAAPSRTLAQDERPATPLVAWEHAPPAEFLTHEKDAGLRRAALEMPRAVERLVAQVPEIAEGRRGRWSMRW